MSGICRAATHSKRARKIALTLALASVALIPDSLLAHNRGTKASTEYGVKDPSPAMLHRGERPPMPDGARLVVETQRFRMVATPAARGLARTLGEEVEALRDRIADDLGQDYDGQTEVRIADRASTFQSLQPYGLEVPTWAVGVAWPTYNVVVINSGPGRTPAEIRRTLAHEISHIALGRLAPRSFPRWFLEGMAIYHSDDWGLSRAGSIAGALMRDGVIPFKDLDESWPSTPTEVRLAYAQSRDFVGWLFRRHGRAAMHRLISEVVANQDFTEAIESATGDPFWKLEYEWRSGLSFRYTWIPAITSGGFFWGITSLLFVFAYLRKRSAKKQRLAAMEAEEEWLHGPDADEKSAEDFQGRSRFNGSADNH